ncbi:MAG TPA: hypothetical protein PKK06_16460 [Phycisphaerae bacterium]|nr:hypothetical protein [Phycisphaerae bacterium]HNU46788.1 hypothetical protein [Phycisphaerae bacterium]
MNRTHLTDDGTPRATARTDTPSGSPGPTRRDVMRGGLKLAFVAPVVTTFFAHQAYAAGSNHSCYAVGHDCDLPGQKESCCPTLVCLTNKCVG